MFQDGIHAIEVVQSWKQCVIARMKLECREDIRSSKVQGRVYFESSHPSSTSLETIPFRLRRDSGKRLDRKGHQTETTKCPSLVYIQICLLH